MRFTCNIDKRGRKARLVTGAIVDMCGIAGILAAVSEDSIAILTAGIFLSIAGLFMIFEGASGWCALRSIGIKTRL
jgi:hypothetical protein